MFHKVKAVAALPDYQLLVHFVDGTAKQYDVAALFNRYDAFRALAVVPGLFQQVTADPGGYGVSWNDEIDIACEELWANGLEIATPFDGLLSFADASALWGLSESALRKAVAYHKLVEGVDALKFGKQWVVSRAAMVREYGEQI